MPTLYVANTTRQERIVYYRKNFDQDDRTPASQMTIAAGRQSIVGGRNIRIDEIETIRTQLEPYGLIAEGEVGKSSHKGVVPMVFNVDRPVSLNTINRVLDMNAGILIAAGTERRAKGAIIANELITKTVAEQTVALDGDFTPKDGVDVEFEQEEQSEAGEKPIGEGYHVPREPGPDAKDPSQLSAASPKRKPGRRRPQQ
jgi:hypothetical protein